MDLSVVICTYNGGLRISKVLDQLRVQAGIESLTWELVVVDNNSQDNTKQVIEAYPEVRYVFEPQQGQAFARQRAVQETVGAWIAFIDDDAVPDQNWVAQAWQFTQTHPQIGAFGGQIHAAYEVEPPRGLNKISPYLAIVERGSKPHRYERVLPPGAGLVVRREAWLAHVPNKFGLVGRTTADMLASEDIEAIMHIQKAGYEIWYNPEMHLYHQIPQWRMERSYLLKLVRGIGLSRHHIRMIRWAAWQRPFITLVYLCNDLRQLIVHWVKLGRSQNLEDVCHQQWLVSSLISPFYLSRLKRKA